MLPHSISQVADFSRVCTAFSIISQFFGRDGRPQFVQLHGQPLPVRDGEVGAKVVTDANHLYRKARLREQLFESMSVGAAGGDDGQSFRAEGVQYAGGIDAAAARRIGAREDVGAILKYQPVRQNVAIDGGIHRESEYQVSMLT